MDEIFWEIAKKNIEFFSKTLEDNTEDLFSSIRIEMFILFIMHKKMLPIVFKSMLKGFLDCGKQKSINNS